MTVVATLASQAPVLIAIDDVQWLDPSSQAVVEYAARPGSDDGSAPVSTSR